MLQWRKVETAQSHSDQDCACPKYGPESLSYLPAIWLLEPNSEPWQSHLLPTKRSCSSESHSHFYSIGAPQADSHARCEFFITVMKCMTEASQRLKSFQKFKSFMPVGNTVEITHHPEDPEAEDQLGLGAQLFTYKGPSDLLLPASPCLL